MLLASGNVRKGHLKKHKPFLDQSLLLQKVFIALMTTNIFICSGLHFQWLMHLEVDSYPCKKFISFKCKDQRWVSFRGQSTSNGIHYYSIKNQLKYDMSYSSTSTLIWIMKNQSYRLVEELLFQVNCAGFVHLIGDFHNNGSDTFASKVNCKDACDTHIRKLLPMHFGVN